jgi:uncharacterized protein
VFLAGDAVPLVRKQTLETLRGLGTGDLAEHFKKVVDGGARIYLSGGSCAARGVTPDEIQPLSVEVAGPPALVRLVMECDRTMVY